MEIPTYKTVAGLVLPKMDTGKSGTLVTVNSTNEKEVRDYAASLEAAGFVRHSTFTLPGGSERPQNTNLFYAYTRADMHIFLSFAAALRTLQIRAMRPGDLPPAERPLTFAEKAAPAVTQLRLTLGGICHIVSLADGSFVLLDGGTYNEEDADRLYAFLQERSAGKPRIALWLFSHPDIDHVQLAAGFLRRYADRVDVAAFAHRFPDVHKLTFLYQDTDVARKHADDLADAISTCFPHASLYTVFMGQKLFFPGVEMEVLWTGDMLCPCCFLTANDTSSVCRFRFDSGKTYLFTGDCMLEGCTSMALVYGDYLKSDIFQLNHHGLIGGELGFYKLIDPDICFWATSEARFAGKLEGQVFQWCIGEGGCDYNVWIRDDTVRKRVHYHNGKTTTVLV